MMKAVRIDTVTTGCTHQRSFRRVGTSGPPRVPPSTTFVELSTAVTHSPCYRPTFECLVNLRQSCESLLISIASKDGPPACNQAASRDAIRRIPSAYGLAVHSSPPKRDFRTGKTNLVARRDALVTATRCDAVGGATDEGAPDGADVQGDWRVTRRGPPAALSPRANGGADRRRGLVRSSRHRTSHLGGPRRRG